MGLPRVHERLRGETELTASEERWKPWDSEVAESSSNVSFHSVTQCTVVP